MTSGNPDLPASAPSAPAAPVDFVRQIVADDLATGRHGGRVATRFPPEPNGYLHIGHAKSICLNFGIAEEYGGACNLRFDDTNPTKEDVEYVEAIEQDVAWLGFKWANLYYASDYFERLYQFAVELIKRGHAYVDSLNADETRALRGTLTEPGSNSPYRSRTVAENLELFAGMRAGEFPDGAHVLRAKIDMASPNLNMRDPTLYRIRHAAHHRTGDAWCIYPMYDFAHPLSDALERITHSICTLEFEDHRPLYDWLVDHLIEGDKPHQYEFARLNLNYTVMSKRKLLQLVEQRHVGGWDDPRLPTIAGLRRRGYTPESIRDFCARIGVAKKENVIDVAQLEHSVREDLNRRAPRVMAVLRPLKVVLTNYPEGQAEDVDVINNPEDPSAGTRKVPFSRDLYIERDDFMEQPPKKFFRLAPGREVRLRCAYFIKCDEVVKNERGEIVELRCTYDPSTRGGDAPDGRKVKATLHWVSSAHAIAAEVRLYDRLFSVEDPERAPEGKTFLDNLNPSSLEVLADCRIEPSLASAGVGERFQFERLGYFCVDPDTKPGAPVFNRTVGLRDAWAKNRSEVAGGQLIPVEYRITQYDLEQGALEIQYIEEFFGEFPRKKTATEIVRRLHDRSHLILLANAALPDELRTFVPVSFKVAHEIKARETEPKLSDLVARLRSFVQFDGRRVLYTWIGGTRRDWRGQGHFRALTEQQEVWAMEQGFDEILVKTKNKFYDMRGTLDHLHFEVVKYERNEADNAESKVYLSKKLHPELLDTHRSAKTVVQMTL